jgi:hypothetical protein
MSLVDNFNGLRTKNIFMVVPVMATKKQIRAAGKHYANIGLCVTAIATIGCGECGCSHRGIHGNSSNSELGNLPLQCG